MEFERAKKYAAHLIAAKMYTCREIYQKLLRKGFDEETAEKTVDEFCRAGILCDAQYAEMYIHDAVNINMKGMYRIKQELLKKGIASSIIDKAIRNSEEDTYGQLLEYARMRFGDVQFSDRRELEKAKAHLLRRGYSYSEIKECFEELDIKVDRGEWY